MGSSPTAAIVTVGTELTAGLRRDTNGGEIARTLAEAGFAVEAIIALPDDLQVVAAAFDALSGAHALVVVTGGLGPTHDDITREAASRALKRPLRIDASLVSGLEARALAHTQAASRTGMLRQAEVLEGARVLPARAGTAPGQVVAAGDTTFVLLPGPPHEMRPLLRAYLADTARAALPPVRLRSTGLTESDVQHLVGPAIAGHRVDFTILAAPGDVEVILFAQDDDAADLLAAGQAAMRALGDACFSADGSTLAEVVLGCARRAGSTIAVAESCTGGLVSAALTDVAGSSDVFLGGIVSYADDVKRDVLGVPGETLELHGAVSAGTVTAMAQGARRLTGADIAVATSGIAGPGGGTPDKPVGLVWFAVATDTAITTHERTFGGDRAVVRTRATIHALDLLRRAIDGL